MYMYILRAELHVHVKLVTCIIRENNWGIHPGLHEWEISNQKGHTYSYSNYMLYGKLTVQLTNKMILNFHSSTVNLWINIPYAVDISQLIKCASSVFDLFVNHDR
jgi:hypothetical protein